MKSSVLGLLRIFIWFLPFDFQPFRFDSNFSNHTRYRVYSVPRTGSPWSESRVSSNKRGPGFTKHLKRGTTSTVPPYRTTGTIFPSPQSCNTRAIMLRRSNNSYLYERLTPRRTVFPVRDDESAVVVATLRDGNDDVRVRDNRAITGTISDHPSSSSKSSSSHRHVVYRSLCDPDVIPDEARDVTWYDPF